MIQNRQVIYLFTLAHYKETLAKQNKNYSHYITYSVGQQTANSRPTHRRQSADSLPTGFLGSSSSSQTKENNHTLQVAKKFNFTIRFSKI